MKKRNLKIQINVSNRSVYTIAILAVLVALAIGVYASPSTLGHSADEIEGVCRTDGIGCNFPDSQANLGLYVNPSDQLCFPTASSASCSTQTTSCTNTANVTTSASACGATAQTACNSDCSFIVACDGDVTPWSCGATSINYNQASVLTCVGPAGDKFITCRCSMSGGSTYQMEVGQNSRCV